jgi:type II secretory pathway predicted ATPase ExeA
MSSHYRAHFGLKSEPFCNDLASKDLLKLPGMVGVASRMDYVHGIGGTMLITGEVGSGKSTSLRWSLSQFHPSQTCVLSLVGNSGGFAEILKMIAMELGLEASTTSRARLLSEIRVAVRDTAKIKKQHVLLVIDEANLLRVEVLAELHTLTQFDHDSRNLLTLVLCGQNSLFDKLQMRSSLPLASRIVSRAHLEPLKRTDMDEYVAHHLALAGVRKKLFEETALTALYQGSGGILRKANALARGGLLAAANGGNDTVTAEHIRLAQSEVL